METAPQTLLLVGRLPRNLQLLKMYLGKAGYITLTATSYEEFDHQLALPQAISGSLIDLTGFDTEIWTRCEYLRTARIPFLIFSPKLSTSIQRTSLLHGAKGVMVKPLAVNELIGMLQNILEG